MIIKRSNHQNHHIPNIYTCNRRFKIHSEENDRIARRNDQTGKYSERLKLLL